MHGLILIYRETFKTCAAGLYGQLFLDCSHLRKCTSKSTEAQSLNLGLFIGGLPGIASIYSTFNEFHAAWLNNIGVIQTVGQGLTARYAVLINRI